MYKGYIKKLMMIAVMAGLCAMTSSCGKEEPKSALVGGGTVSQVETKKDKDDKKEDSEKTDKALDEQTEKTEKSDDQKTETKEQSSDNSEKTEKLRTYSQGKLTSTSYVSEYVGVKFNVPEEYELVPKSEIDAQNEYVANSGDESIKNTKYETIVTGQKNGIQVILTVDQNKGEYDEINYLAGVAANYEQATGAQVNRTSYQKNIGGTDYIAMDIKQDLGSITYCVRKYGNDIIAYVIASPNEQEADVENILSCFEKY